MRFLLTAAIVGLAAAAALAQQPTFRAGTSIVPVLATVLDGQGRLVPNLEREDFTILDNGKPQEVVFFQNDVQPFSVVVMMDFSFSMNAHLKLLKAAAEQFILRMLPEDKGQVGAFSDKIDFSGTFTSDRDDLVAALDELQFGNPTRLYDAIDASIDILDEADGRRVVLVFTDGDDTASRRGFGDVLDKAREKEVMVYAIGLQSEFFNGARMQRTRPDRALRRLADETGGGYFELRKTDELAPTFTRVAQELHSLYALGFTPSTLDGKEHRLDVRVRPQGMNARARRSYIASADRLTETR
jgi:Ca-activated chloride channel family protein